jgi:hypothetical protein
MTGSLCALLCIAISAAIISILMLTRRFLLRTHCWKLSVDLVMALAIFKIAAYYLFPAVTRLMNDWKFDVQAMVLPHEIAFIYIIDLTSYAAWALTIIFFTNNIAERFGIEGPGGGNAVTKREKIFVFLVFVLFIISFKDSLAAVFVPDNPGTEDTYFNPFGPFSIACGQVLGCSVVFLGSKAYGRVNWILSAACFLMFLVFASLSGVRGLVIYPMLWFLFLNLTVKKSIRMYVVGGALLIALGLLHGPFMSLRANEGAVSTELMERIAGNGEMGERSLSDELIWRFGELTRMSVGFKRIADDDQYAGFKPVISALYAPMPRHFFPDKPWPGSVDDDKHGSGMYIIHRKVLDTYNMSEFSTGMHAYWEFGLAGVLICSFIAGLYTSFCMTLSSRFGLTGLALLALSFKPWGYNEPKVWMPELILQITQIIIPLAVLWFIAGLLEKFPRFIRTVLPVTVRSVKN